MINSRLIDEEETKNFLNERIDANLHWIILGFDDFSRTFIEQVEEKFYLGEKNEDFDLLMMNLNGRFLAVAMGLKNHMSKEQLSETFKIDAGNDNQNVLIAMNPFTQKDADKVALSFYIYLDE